MANALFIQTLRLHHFRNHRDTRLEVSSAPVVLFGHNGAGKTNILEAISLLTPGRGLRGAKLAELACAGSTESWAVSARLNGAEGEVQIGTGKGSPTATGLERREVHIDGAPANAQSDLARHCRVLWLTPAMEQLFLDSQSAGRKFLDRLVYQYDAEHASRINAYETAMRERNKLLENNADANWLDAVEQTMVEKAASIAAARLSAIDHINHAIAESDLSFPKPHIEIGGMVEEMLMQNMSALETEERFLEALKQGRNQDAKAGRTLSGTHRCELIVKHREKGLLAAQCSTGEQKALLLSIIIAQSRSLSHFLDITPMLLLDEIVAHLDPNRRLELFDEICETGAQVWMTGTDASLFEGIKSHAQFFEVKNGKVLAA